MGSGDAYGGITVGNTATMIGKLEPPWLHGYIRRQLIAVIASLDLVAPEIDR